MEENDVPSTSTDQEFEVTEYEPKSPIEIKKPENVSAGVKQLQQWHNKSLRIEMTDGRILIGVFLCTDRDANVILGSCSEYLPEDTDSNNEETRMLGLAMIPGKHIVSVHIDSNEYVGLEKPLDGFVAEEDVM